MYTWGTTASVNRVSVFNASALGLSPSSRLRDNIRDNAEDDFAPTTREDDDFFDAYDDDY